ncbi:MAG: hypothetical protein AB1638_10040 [Nitrospirota bacterium]
MDIVKNAIPGDVIFEKDGLKIFIEQKADSMLSDATIDFADEQGFVVNGMSKNTCCS